MRVVKHFLFIVFLLSMTLMFAQPDNVVNEFNKRYSVAENVVWHEVEDYWLAEFTVQDREGESKYSKNGDWIRSEIVLRESEMPAEVRSALDTDYPGYRLVEVESVVVPGAFWFEVEIVITEDKEEKQLEVAYNSEGEKLEGKVDEEMEKDEDDDREEDMEDE